MKYAQLNFGTKKKFIKRDSEKLRKFFTNKIIESFDNYGENSFPKIQYRVIDGNLSVIAIEDAIDYVIKNYLSIKTIIIGNKKLSDFDLNFSIKEEILKIDEDFYNYEFDSLWLPLNQPNYRTYMLGKLDLDKLLQNNILNIFRSCGVEVEKQIIAKGNFKPRVFKLKEIEVTGFSGTFKTNVKLPNYIGLGKKKAMGFGSIKLQMN